MNLIAQIAMLWPSWTFRRAAEKEIGLSSLSLNLSELWPHVERLRFSLPRANKNHGGGVRLLTEYVRWNLALYRVLLKSKVEKSEALELIEKIQWRIVAPASASSFSLSRLKSSSLPERVRWMVDMSFKVLFTRPFQREVIESGRGSEFNITRCPFAEYLIEQNAPELTGAALCAMDGHMARQWGIELDRTTTIASGGNHCDCKFLVPIDSKRRSGA